MTRLGFQCFGYLLLCGLGIVILNVPASQAKVEGKEQAKAAIKALQDRSLADMTLAGHLAERPQLMNIQYLECYLGPKDNSTVAASSRPSRAGVSAIRTLWTDAFGHYNAYKLETSLQSQNDYAAEFDTLIPLKAHRRLAEMDKIMGISAKHSFDEQGQPVDIYDSSPNTKMFVYQAPELVDINKIRVLYEGPVLELPSQSDMQEATQYRRDMATKHQQLGNPAQAITLLQAHLRSHPDDLEAHLQLAQSYQAQCSLNAAINEYRIVLARSGDNEDLRKRALDGLHSLKVDIPAPAEAGTAAGRHTVPDGSAAAVLTGAPTAAAPANIKNEHPSHALDVGF